MTKENGNARVFDHAGAGSLVQYLDDFTGWLQGKGYRPGTTVQYMCGARRFARWALQRRVAPRDGSAALLAFKRHLGRQGPLKYSTGSHVHRLVAARHFVLFLQERGAIACPPPPETAVPALLLEFCLWMQEHRGATERTLDNYAPEITALLASLGDEPGAFEAKRLRAFVLRRITRPHGRGRASTVIKAIRAFLRFLVVTGRCAPGLDDCVPRVAKWKLSSLPRYLSPEAVERVVSACDPSTPTGARDRAVVLLLARLGLRAGEVAGLRLGDIDWEHGTISVVGKSRRQVLLPLTQEVGSAILHYLEHGRPEVAIDRVFITTVAPLRPLLRTTVGLIATRAMKRAGVETPVHGAHVLRHTVATAMLRQGVSMDDIGAVLRHSSIESTEIYAKVDVNLLKEVAMPWPEVRPC